MSLPIVSYATEKYNNMNAGEYQHSSTVHTRPAINHPDNIFRWPHTNNVTERSLYNQYLQEKIAANSPRVDFSRYAENNRYPHESHSRHDHEEQQRLHELHFQQLQKNTANTDMRGIQQSTEIKFPNTDVRQGFLKKFNHDHHGNEMLATFDEHQKQVNVQSDARHQTYPYLIPGISKPSSMTEMRLAHQRINEVSPVPLSTTIANGITIPPLVHPAPSLVHPAPPLVNPALPFVNPAVEESLKTVSSERTNASTERISPTNGDTIKQAKVVESVEPQVEQQPNLQTSTKTSPSSDVVNTTGESNTQQRNLSPVKPESNTASKSTDKKESAAETSAEKKSPDDGTSSPDNGLPSYTAMIAQAILKKEGSKSTLSDIYEYMEKYFPSLEKRGTGWRNCVRHTLSLNDCFIKLHRPENGRSCNWAVHPSYFESFSRGDYRKRRALRKRPRGLQWIDPIMLGGYPFVREHEMHADVEQQQQSPFYHYPPAPGMWNTPPQPGYNNHNQPSPSHLQHFPQPPPPHPGMHPSYPTHPAHAQHMQNNHCVNPDCYCQFNKNSYRGGYTP